MTMKKLCFIAALLLCFSLCSCGVLVDTNTPKSAELSEKYSFYENSVASIRSGCNVSPEEADEIFLVLVNDCGIDKEVTVTPYVNAPYSVKYGAKTLSMTLDGSIVSEVFDGESQIILLPLLILPPRKKAACRKKWKPRQTIRQIARRLFLISLLPIFLLVKLILAHWKFSTGNC